MQTINFKIPPGAYNYVVWPLALWFIKWIVTASRAAMVRTLKEYITDEVNAAKFELMAHIDTTIEGHEKVEMNHKVTAEQRMAIAEQKLSKQLADIKETIDGINTKN